MPLVYKTIVTQLYQQARRELKMDNGFLKMDNGILKMDNG